MTKILNRDRFPDVDFWDEDDFKVIGKNSAGGDVIQVGVEKGTDAPVVANGRLGDKELNPSPVYELLKFSQPGEYTFF